MISRKKLRDFCAAVPRRRRHATAFENWFKITRKAYWRNFQDVKATFGQTDAASFHSGRTATIFDIGGNKYRIVTHIDYTRQTVLIAAIPDHGEYDRNLWKKLF